MNKSLSLALFILVGSCTALAQTAAPTGREVIDKMAAAYAGARTYQDTGVVREAASARAPTRLVNSFKTHFERPGKLRFEWTRHFPSPQRSVVWTGGEGVFAYWAWSGLETQETLDLAIAAATGVSRGAAHMVPTLLIDEITGFRLTDMERVSLLREESFEGEDCYVVRGYHPFNFPIEVWIAKRDLLIRRERHTNRDGRIQEDIRRDIKLDQPNPANIFRYKTGKA